MAGPSNCAPASSASLSSQIAPLYDRFETARKHEPRPHLEDFLV
jgi:hypothetical protein